MQEQRERERQKETDYRQIGKKIEARNEGSVEEGSQGEKQRNKTTACSTAPVISDIHKLILIFVSCV